MSQAIQHQEITLKTTDDLFNLLSQSSHHIMFLWRGAAFCQFPVHDCMIMPQTVLSWSKWQKMVLVLTKLLIMIFSHSVLVLNLHVSFHDLTLNKSVIQLWIVWHLSWHVVVLSICENWYLFQIPYFLFKTWVTVSWVSVFHTWKLNALSIQQ